MNTSTYQSKSSNWIRVAVVALLLIAGLLIGIMLGGESSQSRASLSPAPSGGTSTPPAVDLDASGSSSSGGSTSSTGSTEEPGDAEPTPDPEPEPDPDVTGPDDLAPNPEPEPDPDPVGPDDITFEEE
jgi:hypothetical protein